MAKKVASFTFNYDLVAERAIKSIHERVEFGPWLYGVGENPAGAANVPRLFKLHGSVNWLNNDEEPWPIRIRQRSWQEFDEYAGYSARGPVFPIMLPFWDKKIDAAPWSNIWKKAATRLKQTRYLVVWGYSLPTTDIKARELFSIGLSRTDQDNGVSGICVIDPSKETRQRWRQLFVRQAFWQYDDIGQFFAHPPDWWEEL